MMTGIPDAWTVGQRRQEEERGIQMLRENIAVYNTEIKELNRYMKAHEEDRYTRIRLGGLKKSRLEMKRKLKELECSLAG